MKWGSDDDVREYSWAKVRAIDETDADLPDGFDEDRYQAKMRDLEEASSRLHWVQRTHWYIGRKSGEW